MPRVTVQSAKLVLIKIRGEPREDVETFFGCLPRVPDDGGIIQALLGAALHRELPFSVRSMHVGGGAYVALYTEEDAPLVLAWLAEHGVETEPYDGR